MVRYNIDDIRKNAMTEIREKTKKNPKYLSPMNKERQEDMKKLGFISGNDFTYWMQQNGIVKNPTDLDRNMVENTLKNARCKTIKEYRDKKAIDAGFIDNADKIRNWRHETGRQIPMIVKRDCSSYIGIIIGENIAYPILIEIFGGVDEKMPYGYPGYDLVVRGGYKIDVKTATLNNKNQWVFSIWNNNMADYFLLLSFDNRECLNLLRILLIIKDESIRGEPFWKRESITITNNAKSMLEFQKNDWINRLKCLDETKKIIKMI